MKQFFSIVISTLNEEKYVPCLLSDLAHQSKKNFEVILVDANSKDNTIKAAKKFEKALKIKIVKTKANVSYQRNFGAQRAKGEYIIFLDADYRIESSFIERLSKKLETNTAKVFVPYNKPDSNSFYHKAIFYFSNRFIHIMYYFDKPLSSGGAMVFERNFFKKIGGFNEKLFVCEDHHIVQKAHKEHESICYLSDPSVTYSMRRMKKEGISLYYKYAFSTIYFLLKGQITEKLYKYTMGGHYFH